MLTTQRVITSRFTHNGQVFEKLISCCRDEVSGDVHYEVDVWAIQPGCGSRHLVDDANFDTKHEALIAYCSLKEQGLNQFLDEKEPVFGKVLTRRI